MASSKKNNQLVRKDSQDTSDVSLHRTYAEDSVIEQQAHDLVLMVMNRLETIFSTVNLKDIDVLNDIKIPLAKEIVYNSLLATETDPALTGNTYFKRIDPLKSGVSAQLFSALFDKHASGKEYEYFGTIFQNEYQQFHIEHADDFRKHIEKDRKKLNLRCAQEMIKAWQSWCECQLNKTTFESLTTQIAELLTTIQLKMAKAVLS